MCFGLLFDKNETVFLLPIKEKSKNIDVIKKILHLSECLTLKKKMTTWNVGENVGQTELSKSLVRAENGTTTLKKGLVISIKSSIHLSYGPEFIQEK